MARNGQLTMGAELSAEHALVARMTPENAAPTPVLRVAVARASTLEPAALTSSDPRLVGTGVTLGAL